LVRSNHLHAEPVLLHHKLLAMARAAGCRDVGMVDTRFRITGRQQFVRAAVAVHAGGCGSIADLRRLAVKTSVIGGLLVRMAGRAGDSLWSGFVRSALYVRVAVDAGKHAAVDRVLERLRIDVQANLFAIDLVGEGVIAMARQAFVDSGFWGIFLSSGL